MVGKCLNVTKLEIDLIEILGSDDSKYAAIALATASNFGEVWA